MFTESIFIEILDYCISLPNASISNSLLPVSYTSFEGSTVAVSCAMGYMTNGSMIATCESYNSTFGQWNVTSGECICILI